MQIKEITDYISSLEEKPLIIAGDFNICPEASLKPYKPVENYKNGEISFEYKHLSSKFKNLHIPLQNVFENDETGFSMFSFLFYRCSFFFSYLLSEIFFF